jgi:hypothetical protein
MLVLINVTSQEEENFSSLSAHEIFRKINGIITYAKNKHHRIIEVDQNHIL